MKSKLILISALIVLLSCNNSGGWKHYAELAGDVYERPDSVLMALEGSEATGGARGEAEYNLLKEKSYILYYGIPDAADEGGAAKAIEYFSAKGPAPMKLSGLVAQMPSLSVSSTFTALNVVNAHRSRK